MKQIMKITLLFVSVMVSRESLVNAELDEPKTFNIKRFGAIGDGVAMETEAVQRSINACHAFGGGIVRVPAGDFQIDPISGST